MEKKKTNNEWKIEIECSSCGNHTFIRFWERESPEGSKLKCASCGEEFVIPHSIGNEEDKKHLGWAFKICIE